MTDRPAPGYTPARGEAKFPDLTLHKHEVLDEEQRSKGFRFVEEDVHVVCPWHGFEFNIKTGAHPGDAKTRLNGFEVELRDGAVYVRV